MPFLTPDNLDYLARGARRWLYGRFRGEAPVSLSAMLPPTRTDLRFGRYRTPRFRVGAIVQCSIRGEVRIVGVSSGPIPSPIGQTKRAKTLVIYGALERAIQKESSVAICH